MITIKDIYNYFRVRSLPIKTLEGLLKKHIKREEYESADWLRKVIEERKSSEAHKVILDVFARSNRTYQN